MNGESSPSVYIECPCGVYRHIRNVSRNEAIIAVKRAGWSSPKINSVQPNSNVIAMRGICKECQELEGGA